jgi:aldehyde:ferredoxin oxidoreductase
MQANSYMGKMLWVDLNKGELKVESTPEDDLNRFIGGRGLGIKLLTDLAPQGVDPLAPENPVIFATGPYTGNGVFSAFFNVTTKAPLTGIALSSHCGGHWGPRLKKAGFDGIVITGASSEPCYLVIEEGRALLKPAGDIWGKGLFETEQIIKEKEGQAEVVAIGPAGENLVRFAALMNSHRAAGRGGAGAVLGSKKLKAIAVKGKLPINPADAKKVSEISRNGAKLAVEGGAAFAKYGSSIAFNVFNEAHALPTKNFRGGHFSESENIDAEALKAGYFVKDRGCFNCPLKCGNIHKIPAGPYQLDEVEGPEYETLMAFGSNCANTNLESILKANYLCNDLGMDTITCGNLCALLMDLYDLKIINQEQLDGFSMNWGEHESIIDLIPRIAAREGIGDLLAEGSYRAAEKWGPAALERVIHAKKQEYPGYESRRSFATGFSLVTSNRGACHLRAAMYVNEIFAGEFEKDGFERHMATLVDKEHYMALADSYLTCKFGMRNAQYTMPVLTELYQALTGTALSEEELMQAGERIWNLERLYNLREGAEADMPAPRLFQENLDDGQKGGEAISKERFLEALDLYYTARGWSKDGVPSAEKLMELGLADY